MKHFVNIWRTTEGHEKSPRFRKLCGPGSRCPRFFTRYVKQAGALPAVSAVPWRQGRGHDITALWTRAPFFEMWGKPKDCREPQVDDVSIMDFLALVNPYFDKF